MSWKGLLEQPRVAREEATRAEIEAQREMAERAIADSAIEAVSDDGRFDRAYDAARALATRSFGFRPRLLVKRNLASCRAPPTTRKLRNMQRT